MTKNTIFGAFCAFLKKYKNTDTPPEVALITRHPHLFVSIKISLALEVKTSSVRLVLSARVSGLIGKIFDFVISSDSRA